MKKIWILAGLTVAVLAAVCVAGCTETPDTNITGTWIWHNDTATSILFFAENQTGIYRAVLTGDTAALTELTTTFVWNKSTDTGYHLVFPDDTGDTVLPDMVRGVLTFGGKPYEKQPDAATGTTGTIGRIHRLRNEPDTCFHWK